MTTIPDIKSTYKTWFTWASLTPAQQAFATSQGYSSGSVSVAIGDIVDYVTQVAASTQTLLVDANGDPVCNYGFNGVANIPTDCSLEVNSGVLGLATISAQASLSVGNTPIAPTPASGTIIIPTQTISITNPSACKSMAYLFVCPGVDMSIVGASTNGSFLGIQSQININGGAFFQTSDTTLATNGVSGVGYIGHDSNTNGHVLTGTIAPGASVSIGLRVQFIKGSAAGTYSSLAVQGFHMSIIGSLI